MNTLIVLSCLVLACLAQNNDCSSNDPSTLASCLEKVSSSLVAMNRSFLPSDVMLSMRLDLQYTTESIHFESCCNNYVYMARTYDIDPLDFVEGNTEYLSPVEQRSAPTVSVSAAMMNSTGKNRTYTLLMLDLSMYGPIIGTQDRPLAHWLVMNFDLRSELKSLKGFEYLGPAPRARTPNTYAFFLFEQPGFIDLSTLDMTQYGSCPPYLAATALGTSRCLFDVPKFITDNSLALKGATWYQSLNDAYTNYTNIQGGQPESVLCQGVAGYANPCPAGAANLGVSILALIAVCLFQFMF